MGNWKSVIDEMNQQQTKDNDFLFELVNYQYGYVGWCIDMDNDDQAEEYLSLAEENIEMLEKAGYKLSLVNAYKSAFYGFRIGLNIFKAPFIGPKSVACAESAMKLDEKNPYGYIQYGNSQYYMPATFGGSKTVALAYFTKAQLLMETDEDQLKEDWNYLTLLSMIAKAHTELKDYASAKACYEKILRIEPNILWVRNELYPELLKKINQ
jgi:tetratricopeptide (TPR) repeat protein